MDLGGDQMKVSNKKEEWYNQFGEKIGPEPIFNGNTSTLNVISESFVIKDLSIIKIYK